MDERQKQSIIDLSEYSSLYNNRKDGSKIDLLLENQLISKNFLLNKFTNLSLNDYLNRINLDTKFDVFYISVGSAPHDIFTNLDERINNSNDQMMPRGIRELIGIGKSIQIYCIDHTFDEKHKIYFNAQKKEKDYTINYTFEDNNHKWRFIKGSQIVEVILLPFNFYMDNIYLPAPKDNLSISSEPFIMKLINFCIDNNKLYIQQDFVGQNDNLLLKFHDLYDNFNKDKQGIFKNKILFDMSYGLDVNGCYFNSDIHKPIYDSTGENFINYSLFEPSEFDTAIDSTNNERTIKIIKFNIINLYKTRFFITTLTTVKIPNPIIFRLIIRHYLPVFRKLNLMDECKQAIFTCVFLNYDTIAENYSGIGVLMNMLDSTSALPKRIQKIFDPALASTEKEKYFIFNKDTNNYE
jgi:hypothetical protein